MEISMMTFVPNVVFDVLMPGLAESELKIMLVVLRQTYGWKDARTGRRKARDRISISQFTKKTGLSRRIVSKSIKSLHQKGLLEITGVKGNILRFSEDRKGKKYLFYSFVKPVHFVTQTNALKCT